MGLVLSRSDHSFLRTPLVELAAHADEIGEMIERQLGYGAVKRDRKLDRA